MNALRAVAALASDYLELERSYGPGGRIRARELRELGAALDELRARFPYTLQPALPAGSGTMEATGLRPTAVAR